VQISCLSAKSPTFIVFFSHFSCGKADFVCTVGIFDSFDAEIMESGRNNAASISPTLRNGPMNDANRFYRTIPAPPTTETTSIRLSALPPGTAFAFHDKTESDKSSWKDRLSSD